MRVSEGDGRHKGWLSGQTDSFNPHSEGRLEDNVLLAEVFQGIAWGRHRVARINGGAGKA